MRLDGLHAVVTGASRGLGVGIAAGLASAGARVTIVAEQAAELDEARAQLAAGGADVAAARVDLADREAVLGLGRRIAAGPDAADVLVNNAAVLPMVAAEITTDAIWDRTIAVNLTAPFLLLRTLGLPLRPVAALGGDRPGRVRSHGGAAARPGGDGGTRRPLSARVNAAVRRLELTRTPWPGGTWCGDAGAAQRRRNCAGTNSPRSMIGASSSHRLASRRHSARWTGALLHPPNATSSLLPISICTAP